MNSTAAPKQVRIGLSVSAACSAGLFGWAAFVLPWRPEAPLALLAFGLALLHAATAFTALCWPRRLRRAWRLLAIGSLLCGLVFTLAIGTASIKLVRMYGDLGWGLTALLATIGLLLWVATLPMGVLGLRWTRSTDETH
jgi:hypothetical protein